MSYYIKGDKDRGEEVIKLLESRGGINREDLTGIGEHIFYYIGKNNIILSCLNNGEIAYLVTHYLTELTLPEKQEWKPKFKAGDYVRIQDGSPCVITACKFGVYNVVCCENQIYTTELEYKLTPWSPKRGEPVLVRNAKVCVWDEAVLSFILIHPNGSKTYHTVGGNNWDCCIPFDEDKLGKITD